MKNEANECSPCWAFNLFNRKITIFLCDVFLNGMTEDTKVCPCRSCLIRSTCEERCDAQSSFSYKATQKRIFSWKKSMKTYLTL